MVKISLLLYCVNSLLIKIEPRKMGKTVVIAFNVPSNGLDPDYIRIINSKTLTHYIFYLYYFINVFLCTKSITFALVLIVI